MTYEQINEIMEEMGLFVPWIRSRFCQAFAD